MEHHGKKACGARRRLKHILVKSIIALDTWLNSPRYPSGLKSSHNKKAPVGTNNMLELLY
jgi:hypothetical protein